MWLLPLLLACNPEAKADGYALAFAGEPSCVAADVSSLSVTGPFTAELWFRGDTAPYEEPHPLAEWLGVFLLSVDADGFVSFAVGPSIGASYGVAVMDGVLHHVAGVFDGENANLFVDGGYAGVVGAAVEETTAGTLNVGCDHLGNGFQGLVDDIHVSSVARYTDTFSRPTAAAAEDPDTMVLLPFDEGDGETTLEVVSGGEAAVYEASWVEFSVAEGG